MNKIFKFSSYAKYIGLIAVPSLFWDLPILGYFWLFWLFGLLEIIIQPRVFCQSCSLILGMITVPLKYGKKIPSIENYTPACDYRLPFDGAWMVVNGGLDSKSSHSWSIPTQRYAYDFIICDDEGNSFKGDEHCCESYYCYNRQILAPADGEVVELAANRPNSDIPGKGRVECKADDIRGNYILLKHNDKEYSLFAHLKPQSICVARGDRVRQGQVLALCGNSGNTTEPHLHYQLQNGASFSFSTGLPIRFTDISREEWPDYGKYDPRGAVETPAAEGYIVRGMVVQNAARN